MTPLAPFGAHWPALSALLDEALDLRASERGGWLAGLSGPRALHRETLRALLDHQADVETGDFLDALPRLGVMAASGPADVPGAGASIGAYRLIAEIGRGGMGTVWLAERADGTLKRRVALKLPRIAWGGDFAERLAREREILATLAHENIARLYDAGIDAHDRPFLAMEHVEGETIDAHCRAHALPVRECIALLLQVMAAVGHAHARLVVHRDLKPGNILVTRDATVKLLDFGIAKLLEGETTRSSALTELSGRALTLDYASPEQIRGEPLGTASDVYALGVVAYELLAGARPYRLERGSVAEMEEAIANAEPRLASDAAASPVLKKALRGDLDAILNCALKKAVADRYASVEAFAQDLQRHLRGEPVQARPDSTRYRLGRFIGRHRLAVAMSTALAVSVLTGGVLSLWQAQEARAQERRATREVGRQRAVRDLYVETMSRLSVLGAEHPDALAKPAAVTSVLQDKLREMAPRFADRPDERAAQLEATMLQLNYDNRFEESLAVGREYLAHLMAHGDAPARVITAYATLGRTLYQLRRREESEAMRRAGTVWAPEAHDRDTEVARMGIASDLGGILTARGQRDEALTVLTRADAAVAARYAEEHLRFENMTQLAAYHLGFDDEKALEQMRMARAELAANGTADPDQQALIAWQLGNALLATGQAAEAEAALNESLTIYRREFGRDSRNAVRAFGPLMGAVARRDGARALRMIDDERRFLAGRPAGISRQADLQLRARQLEAAWLAGDTPAAIAVPMPKVATLLAPPALRENEFALLALCRALVQAGRTKEALQLAQILQRGWPDHDLPTASWLRIQETLAEAQLAAGEPAAAGRTAADSMAMLERQHATTGRAYRAASSLGALAAVRSGDRALASRLIEQMAGPLEKAQAVPPFPSGAERADCELRRAQALLELGRPQEAAAVARSLQGDLAGQHAASPRLALASRLIAAP